MEVIIRQFSPFHILTYFPVIHFSVMLIILGAWDDIVVKALRY
jgi:hypothetical protein